jgi:hypothetical protein
MHQPFPRQGQGFSKRGQGKAEYIIILVLIALAVMVAVLNYGSVLQEKFLGSDVRIETELDVN